MKGTFCDAPHMNIVVETERKKQGKIQEAWARHTPALTKWAYQSLYARDNAYPVWVKEVDDWRCVHTDLTEDVFQNHFHGRTTIGTYTLGPDSKCLYIGWDIDHHDGDLGDPAANWRYARILCHRLTRMGASPLLEDSNGSGGYHVWLRFDERITGSVAHSVANWLVRHCPAGIHAEAFPKQPDLNETRRYGNQMRLPGATPQARPLEQVLRRRDVAGRRGCVPLAAESGRRLTSRSSLVGHGSSSRSPHCPHRPTRTRSPFSPARTRLPHRRDATSPRFPVPKAARIPHGNGHAA